ncbi:PKD domain-containing protein [Candidatus Bipolaricaulota bacterium]
MLQRLRVLLLMAGLCLLPLAAMGKDIVVSTDGTAAFRSVQRAIDAADYGDVILINPGIYEETVVLSSGITLRGSGPSHTIIRSSYGYQPVVQGTVVGAVVIEGIKLERAASILESVVVDLQSSQIVFRDCRISGGQQGGVRSVGLALLTFEDCDIDANLGYGLLISEASELKLKNCRITNNDSYGLHLRDTEAIIEDSLFQWNEWEGIRLEGTATLACSRATISANGRWGLTLFDSSQARLIDSTLSTQALGNVSIDDSTSLGLEDSQLSGGIETSIQAAGASELRIVGTHITDASGDGLRLAENATLFIDRSVIAQCSGNGLSLDTKGSCFLQHITVAYNGGHGLKYRGCSITATHSIFALNGGIGLSVSASSGANQSMRFDYNNIWGNRSGDYAGIHRSSSDISAAPEFADPGSGSFALLSNSPCIGAGEFGLILGASGNPAWDRGARFGFGLTRTETDWGAVEARIRGDASGLESLDGQLRWMLDWGFGSAEIESSLTGLGHLRTQASFAYSPSTGAEPLGGILLPAFQIIGILDGDASRWQASGSVEILGGAALRIGGSYEGPTGLTSQEIDLTSHAFSLSGRATDLTFTDLSVAWEDAMLLGSIESTLGIDLRLVPNPRLAVTTRWHLQDGTIQLEARSYLQQLGTSYFSLSWSDGTPTRASVGLQLRSGQFEDVEARVSVRLANLELSGSLGANSENGPRCRLDVIIDTNQWFAPRINQSPMPAYSHTPFEPEAGEPVEFDASASYAPDGEIDQIWWDFGDGEMAIGSIVEHVFQEPGDYTISLTISDESGAVTTLIDAFTVYEPQTTPVAAFLWAPLSEAGARLSRPLRAGDPILLDAEDSYDPDGEIVEYGWDLQSDGVFDHTSSEPRIVIDPLPAGTWPVTLRIVDQAGYSDAVMHVLAIEELKPPEARFEISPAAPAVADPIRFFDKSIEWDGSILSWEWEFGDGDTSTEREPTHRYIDTGDFEILLTVRDTEGLQATARQMITVHANPELVPVDRVWALLIGISDYAEVDDLSYAHEDARSMAEWLISSGVPADQIRLLTDNNKTFDMADESVLESSIATLVNVREGLGWLRQRATRDDLVLIHFSGHGYQGADDNLDERDGVDEFFVLHDTRAAAKDDTALRDDEFGRFLDRIESDHVLVFFDSCYSGGLSRSLTPGSRATGEVSDVFSDFNLEGRLVLSASSENQDAFESPELQHGVLTHFLLAGLNGAGDLNEDGHVTVWELFEYVRSEVPPFVESERGEQQLPQLIGEGESRVVLVRPQSAQETDD